MARPLQKPAEALAPPLGRKAAPALVVAVPPDGDGPARRLQRELECALAGGPEDLRWSARRSTAFALAVNGALWLALAGGLRTVL